MEPSDSPHPEPTRSPVALGDDITTVDIKFKIQLFPKTDDPTIIDNWILFCEDMSIYLLEYKLNGYRRRLQTIQVAISDSDITSKESNNGNIKFLYFVTNSLGKASVKIPYTTLNETMSGDEGQ